MKTATITYEIVCKEINELVQNGEKITVRNVLARTGGSVSRIMEFIKLWREENNISKLTLGLGISEELQRALLLDKSAAVAKTATAYKTQLADMDTLLQEANEILKSQEVQQAEGDKALGDLTQRLALLSGNENTYKEKIKLLEDQLKVDQDSCNQISSNLAKSEIRLENADAIIVELTAKVTKQEGQLLQLTQAQHMAEKDCAVWQAKHQQLSEQMTLLVAKINKK